MIDENSTFGGFLTDIGEAKQANANALEIPWKLTHMLLGDANGTDPVPVPDQTQLVNQVYRAAINQLSVDPTNPAILIAEIVLPPNVGGWWIRELGLEDEDGDFVAVANCPPSYKPLLAQGSGRNQVVRMHLILSNTANVQLKIDPSVVLATRKYVDDHAASRNHPGATTAEQGMVRFALPQEHLAGTVENRAAHPAGVASMIEAAKEELQWQAQPLGVPIAVYDHLPGVSAPPTNNSNFRYVRLTAGQTGAGQYNNGVLSSESVSGSAPLVLATAQVNLPSSPMHGAVIRLLNTEGRYLKPGTSPGAVANDQMQRITGSVFAQSAAGTHKLLSGGSGAISTTNSGDSLASSVATSPTSRDGRLDFDSANSPGARTGNSTDVKHVEATYYMRVA